MSDPTELGVAALAAAYAAQRLDPAAVIDAYLARIAREDGALRSYITVAAETARVAALKSRARWLEHRPLGPLDGIPIALKDNIDVAGMTCTAGTAAFRNRVPDADAPVAQFLQRQGAVLLGKLNMHEGALGATTDNPVYGRCMNPLRAGYTPGGSSGGSAAAVAARLCAAALGTDTLGSVRLPAAYCGVLGFKPTNGSIRSDGVVPLSFTLDTVGLLARSAEDIKLVAIALFDPPVRVHAAHGNPGAVPAFAGLQIGVPLQLDEVDIQPAVRAAFAGFLDALRAAGASIVGVDLSPWNPAIARRAGLLIAEAEGHHYYAAQLGADLPGLSASFAANLRYPARAGIQRIVAAYAVVEGVHRACMKVFREVDMLALPTAPQTSFAHESRAPDNQADCTALANFARAPAISLPMAGESLPSGVQLVGAPGCDRSLLEIATAAGRILTPGAA